MLVLAYKFQNAPKIVCASEHLLNLIRIQFHTHFDQQCDPFLAILTLWVDPLVKSKLKYVGESFGKKLEQVATPSHLPPPLRSSQAAF